MNNIRLEPGLYKKLEKVASIRKSNIDELVYQAVSIYLDIIEGIAALKYSGKSDMELYFEKLNCVGRL